MPEQDYITINEKHLVQLFVTPWYLSSTELEHWLETPGTKVRLL